MLLALIPFNRRTCEKYTSGLGTVSVFPKHKSAKIVAVAKLPFLHSPVGDAFQGKKQVRWGRTRLRSWLLAKLRSVVT